MIFRLQTIIGFAHIPPLCQRRFFLGQKDLRYWTLSCLKISGIGIDIGIFLENLRYWYWYLFLKILVSVSVLVLKWKMWSIGIDIGIEFANFKYWYRYWYWLLVLQDEISVSFKTSRYRASMSQALHCSANRTLAIPPFFYPIPMPNISK